MPNIDAFVIPHHPYPAVRVSMVIIKETTPKVELLPDFVGLSSFYSSFQNNSDGRLKLSEAGANLL
jgi:hypothetical protein